MSASALFEATVRASIVLSFALGSASLLRRQSAAVRHWVLASAIVCAALVPVLGAIVPSWSVPISSERALAWIERRTPFQISGPGAAPGLPDERLGNAVPAEFTRPRAATANPASMATLSGAIVPLWIAGVAISVAILAAGLGRLAWVASRARPVVSGPWADWAARIAADYGLRRPVRVLQTDHPALLVTWGAAHPRIVLPRSAPHWSDDRIRIVLAHELAHVARSDWLIHLFGEIVRAVYWFNPLVWLACRRLRQESEHATDDAVLNRGIGGSEYAEHLLNLARALRDRRRTCVPAPAIARPSSLERRVRAMLNERTDRKAPSTPARLATIAAVLSLTVVLAAAQGSFARFSGTVFDETNGFIPGATLILTNPETRSKHEVVSDRSGQFEFVGLPPGEYQLETKVTGFATLRGTLTLSGQDARRDLVLQIGSLEETIRVTGPGTSPWPGRAAGATRPARRPDPTCEALPAGGMGGNIRAPRKLVDVKPYYPPPLYGANIGGTLVLQALIDTEGRVGNVDVISPAHPDLNAAAIDAVRQWEFDPTILNCSKVDVRMKVTVTFTPR